MRIVRSMMSDRRASSAVEFAIICPLLLALVFGIIVYGSYIAMVHSVQQLAAEAARSSVAGITDGERASLAQANIAANVGSYPLLAADRLTLAQAATDASGNVFTVSLRYDASGMFLFNLPAFVPAPSPIVERTAVIQRGGY